MVKKKENITRLSQHMKEIGHRPTWDGIKTVHYNNSH